MIIVEGPDGTGKTKLCERLVEEFDLTYRRYPKLSSTTGPDGPGIAEWWDLEIAEQNPNNIYDRCFFVSEIIYQLATPHRYLTVPASTMIDGITRLWTFSPLFIFCDIPWEAAIANIGQRDRLEGVDDRALEKVHWAYRSIYAMWSNALFEDVVTWDYTKDSFDLVADRVREYRPKTRGNA